MLACAQRPHEQAADPGLPSELSEYAAWLRKAESAYDDIKPGAERTIQWADPDAPQKTPISLIYFHGYSATRQEVSPVCEQVGEAIGANVYFTRLAGHGRSDDAMAEALFDEAWQEGRATVSLSAPSRVCCSDVAAFCRCPVARPV